ncbi:MAG: polyprenyl synthetase family protein [Flavobacteriales bacterium]
MKNLAHYSALLENALREEQFPATPQHLYDPLRYFMQLGGKRLRPMLSLMACKMTSGKAEPALPVALAVEYFHNFSLIHDDIMDAAPLRRAQATVHEKWNTNIAILSGDVLLVRAYDCLAQYEPALFKALFQNFNKTATEVCEGQQMDMDFEQRTNVSEAEYLEMIRLKTSVLLGCALQMGALVGNASSENAQLLYQFGEQLGLAFQIQDDILDLYGESAQVGKQIGGDVLANKKTLLSIAAQKMAKPEQLLQLVQLETHPNPDVKIAQTKVLYQEIGALDYCKKTMEAYHQNALNALENMAQQCAKNELLELADFLLNRAH